jgi:DNA polymerase I-like protein with 3'-5' exonuclease and polymerase domains
MRSLKKIIQTEEELDELIGYCKETGYASVDFETSSLDYYEDFEYPLMLGCSFQPGSTWIIPLAHFQSVFKDDHVRILKKFGKEVISNPRIVKIAYNAKFELKWFKKYGITVMGRFFDAMLAKYLLNEERPNDLKSMVRLLLPDFADYESNVRDKTREWVKIPLDEMAIYCGIDCDATFRLLLHFENKCIRNNFYMLFRNMNMMLTRVLGDTEFQGLLVDKPYLENLKKEYDEKITNTLEALNNHHFVLKYDKARLKQKKKSMVEALKAEIDEIKKSRGNTPKEIGAANKKIATRQTKMQNLINGVLTTKKDQEAFELFNFASPNQLIELLFNSKYGFQFDIVKYTVDKKTKKETSRPSTDESVLEVLSKQDDSGFLTNLLDFRGLSKLYATYIVGTLERMATNNYIHTNYKIHGTVTCRLSSENPNLQNIPRGTTSKDIKRMFIPPPGHLLVELDYSQAELRVAAEMSGDETMIEMFAKGYSMHVATAAKMAKMDYAELRGYTKDESHPQHDWANKMKKKAKTYNFGILYGQSAKKLAETITNATHELCTEQEAQDGLDDWFKTFPGIKKWIKRQHNFAKEHGYVTNPFGFKRRLHKINSPKYGEVLEALRQSVNAPIQGAASYFTLFSAIVIWEKVRLGELPPYLKMCYTVHDSLGFYVLPEDIHKLVPTLIDICSNPQTLDYFGFKMEKVNMKAEVEVGRHWADLHEYKKDEDYSKWLN